MRLARLSAGIISLLCIGAGFVSAQEALLSTEENYYQFLSLDGSIEKPYLNYRTLSDSSWDVSGIEGPWAGELLGGMKSLTEDMSFRLYGPSLYTSWNSAAPYGQNDGALWQGKGFNSSFSAGARLEGFGFELTLKPDVSFSQNLAFDLVTPNTVYSGNDAYAGKAGEYGYYGIASIDAPQRFGDDSFYTLSWGDSEIRYTWKTLTAGFGTQLIWLGPARINPILHSNNAAPYPKADIGIRPTQVELPYLGWNLGKVEARTWVGQLSESDWFDNNPDNDRNMISGLTVSWAPSFLEGLTFGLHRTMLSKWSSDHYTDVFTLLWPFMESSAGKDESDQRASLSAEYSIPNAGFDLYVEWGRNDFSPSLDFLIRYPFHTQGYTLGGVKSFNLMSDNRIKGQFRIELSNIESSRDSEIIWPTTFYAHHIIQQGYTNQGQWLGPGIGTGGNSQHIAVDFFLSKSAISLFVNRKNPDNDYVWFSPRDSEGTSRTDYDNEYKLRADISIGVSAVQKTSNGFSIGESFAVTDSHNYDYSANPGSIHRINAFLSTVFQYEW
ncbi:MAG: hypothetical protein JXP39_09845 [Spirochaetales bacterium]|nr:hypothetical protein [Spirochaetales bacterium]